MVNRYGILGAVERIVTRPDDAVGYQVLVQMGLEELAFESVVLRHQDSFSPEAVAHSRERLARWRGDRSELQVHVASVAGRREIRSSEMPSRECTP
jgi:hypothetical protein